MKKIFSTRKKLKLKWLWRSAVLACLFFSCVKNNTHLELPGLLVYVDPTPSSTLPYNELSNTILFFRDSIDIGKSMAFPARLFTAYDKDIQLTATIDTSLLPVYDRFAKTTIPSIAVAAGAFSFVNATVTLKAGSIVSADSIKLALADTSGLDLSQTYIVPVRLKSTTPGILSSSDTIRQTMFFRISLTKVLSTIPSSGDSIIYIQLVNQSDSTFLQNFAAFDAGINTATGAPLTVNITPALSLVACFNAANNTSYSAPPSTSINIITDSATIPANSPASSNIFNIQFSAPLALGTTYLLPLKIKDEGIVPPGPRSAVYVVATVESETIYSRGDWKIISVSAADTADGAMADNILDGNYNTVWASSYSGSAPPPQWFILDMGRVNELNGVMILQNVNTYNSFQPKQARVNTSLDNMHWDEGQDIDIPAIPVPNKNLFINLPTSVQARYIKLEVISTHGDPQSGVMVAEFGAY